MFVVLMAGAIVTKTGSGRGCGDDWPLCNGKFIPAYTLESLIEYSHRMTTGIVGLLVLATFLYTWRHYRNNRKPFWYAGGTLFFTIVQALMGAAAVKWPQQPAVMALHFGISLLAVSSSMLLVLWTYRSGRNNEQTTRKPMSKSLVFYSLGVWVFCYGVVYLGAYIRHMEAEAGCAGWPLCNDQIVPPMSGAASIVFLHRLAALVLFFLVLGVCLFVRKCESKRNGGIFTETLLLLLLVIGQMLSGVWLTLTINNDQVYLFTSLLHNGLATLLFGVLTDISIRLLK
ncbi:heme A synthase [Paenibacillus oralis]|uniref:Heme A synthase n=1 Tax=Paenibacillus oralis TaxID=2490856 RepID=A0A3P3UHP5_9BACL|nr:heme A synthase [Paenibacillus oralis]